MSVCDRVEISYCTVALNLNPDQYSRLYDTRAAPTRLVHARGTPAAQHQIPGKMATMIPLILVSRTSSYHMGPSFTYKTGQPVTRANAVFGEACTVLPNRSGTPPALAARKNGFTPEGDPRAKTPCAELQDAKSHKRPVPEKLILKVPVGSCVNESLAAVYPCPEGGFIQSDPGKYCRPPRPDEFLKGEEAKAMDQCARISVPILLPGLTEWFVHPTNINHVGRDLAFLAGMIGVGRRSGHTVMIGGLEGFAKNGMGSWGKHLIAALVKHGGLKVGNWVEEADRMLKSLNIRRARSEFPPVKKTNNVTAANSLSTSQHRQRDLALSDLDILSCGVVCATVGVKYAVSGFVEPEDAALMQQAALKYCNLPLDPPEQRSLFLITRKGLRSIHNLNEVNERLERYAKSLGLEYVAQNIGAFDFCGQVRLASQAVIMVGIQGADPANLFFMHADSMFVELYGNNDPSTLGHPAGISSYMQQVAGAGRRGNAMVLLNVSGCEPLRNWMYDSKCKLDLQVEGLIETLKTWGPPHLRQVNISASPPAAAPVPMQTQGRMTLLVVGGGFLLFVLIAFASIWFGLLRRKSGFQRAASNEGLG